MTNRYQNECKLGPPYFVIEASHRALQIIPLAFLINIASPTLNFANAGDNCTASSGSSLFYCPQI